MEKIKTTLIKIIHNKDTYKAIFAMTILFIAYQAFVVVPQKKLEAERIEKIINETKYKFCVSDAETRYDNLWESNCGSFSVGKDGNSCLLPTRIADRLNEIMETDKKTCVTLYK